MTKAIIFDLDGTLLNTLGDLTDAVNATMRRFGYPEKTEEEVRLAVGNGAAKLLERTLPEGASGFDGILSWYKAYYSEHSLIRTEPYPGVADAVKELSERGMRLAVVSNKQDDAVKLLCARFFGDTIPVAIGERTGVRKKPAPDSLFAAMEELGVAAEDCVYVGDSDVDILTARNAGIPCVSVSWGFRDGGFLAKSGAGTIIARPEELFHNVVL